MYREKSKYERALIRIKRILIGKKGVYGKYGKGNHFSNNVILYEASVIGNYNYLAPYVMVNNCSIGNYCSIGPGAKMGLADHDLSAASTRVIINNGDGNMQLFDYSNPTIIENDVWIGANAVIKQGIKIGTGAVIGANSVVTKDVPEYAIVVGSPARIIRYRFSNDKIEKLIKSNWFQYDPLKAKAVVKKVLKGET